MERNKLTLLAFFAFLFIIGFSIYLNHNPEYSINRVQDAFTLHDYDKAERLLKGVKGQIPEDKYNLYLAYIQRSKHQISDSDTSLKKALQASQTNPQKDIMFEIYLNQALNAYLEHNRDKFKENLQSASDISPGDDWLVFLKGILNYVDKDYKKALSNWETIPWSSTHSPWLQIAFKDAFDSNWISMRIIRSQIETGDFLEARQLLEQESQQPTNPQEAKNIPLLLGLTYVKEGSSKSPSAEVPYDKLAVTYFNRVQVNEPPYDIEMKSVMEAFQNQAVQLIKDESFQDAFFYIETLKNWGATNALKNINASLMQSFNKALAEKNWKNVKNIASIFTQSLTDNTELNNISSMLNTQLEKTALEGDPASMVQLLETEKMVSVNPRQIPETVKLSILSDILNYIPLDNSDLILTSPFIVFSTLIKDDQLIEQILGMAQYLWEIPGMQEKAISMLELIAKQKDPTPAEKEEVSQTMRSMYAFSLKSENTQSMLLLANTLNATGNNDILKTTPEEIERRFSDIKALKAQGYGLEALQEALFVLRINPNDTKTITEAGLLSYELGNYTQAFKLLSTLPNPSLEIEEALYVSKILMNTDTLQQIPQEQFKEPLSRNALLTLGLETLIQGHYEASQFWLNKIKPVDNEALVGFLTIAYMKKNWEEVNSIYNKLPSIFQNLESVKSMHIQALKSLGDTEGAKIELEALLVRDENLSKTSPQNFSSPFILFKKAKLDLIDRNFVAGDFYFSRQDFNRALAYLNQDPSPSAENFIARAEIYLASNDYRKAKEALRMATEIANKSSENQVIKKQILPMHAKVFTFQGRYADAWLSYSKYFELLPEDEQYRSDFANILRLVGRSDLALKEYDLISKTKSYSTEDLIHSIECYIQTNQFDVATDLAIKTMRSASNLTVLQQIHLAKAMTVLRNQNIVSQVLKNVTPLTNLTFDENIALIDLWINLAEYPSAVKLVETLQNEINKNAQALLVVATLHENLSDTKRALDELQMALQLQPDNYLVRMANNHLARDPESLMAAYTFYQKDFKEEPNTISPRIASARVLINTAIDRMMIKNNNKGQAGDSPAELNQANNLLDNLASQYDQLPAIFRYQGEVLSLLNKNPQAEIAFKKSINLNPAEYESYRYLALILDQSKDYIGAESLLMSALKFAPNNVDIWRQLALVNTKRNLPLETIFCLNQLIKFRPNDFDAYFTLGNQWIQLKNPEGAIKAFEMVLKISPDNIYALKSILIALYDPALESSTESLKSLREKRDSVYAQLHDRDPALAEKLISEINKGN